MMEVCEVRDECPDDTSQVVTEDCVNNNLYDTSRKYLSKIDEIGVDEEGGYIFLMENEDIIDREVDEN